MGAVRVISICGDISMTVVSEVEFVEGRVDSSCTGVEFWVESVYEVMFSGVKGDIEKSSKKCVTGVERGRNIWKEFVWFGVDWKWNGRCFSKKRWHP